MKYMTRTIRTLLLLIITVLFSCEDKGFYTDCIDCTSDEPLNTILDIKFDPDLNNGILIQLWEGNLEDSLLVDSEMVFYSTYEKSVTLNRAYTVTATYIKHNIRYITVDSATPRVRFTKDQCEEPCYYVYDKSCDLRLKYTK